MTKSPDNTKRPTPTKPIVIPSIFKDVTKPGTHEIIVGMKKPPKKG
jgi:hypothetical protein